jgi:hypothetical protein
MVVLLGFKIAYLFLSIRLQLTNAICANLHMLRGLYDQRKTKNRMWNISSREPVTLANQLLCDSRGTYGETAALAKLRERLLVPAGYLDGLEIVSSTELGKELATRQTIVHQLCLAIPIS